MPAFEEEEDFWRVPTKSPKALSKMLFFLERNWRPWDAVIEDRKPKKREIEFFSQPSRIAIGSWGAWEALTLKWVAIQVGRCKRFPELDLPLRRSFPVPCQGRIPYYLKGQNVEIPILINTLWTPELLFEGARIPSNAEAYLVDQYGISVRPISKSLRTYNPQGAKNAELFEKHARIELVRLSAIWRP